MIDMSSYEYSELSNPLNVIDNDNNNNKSDEDVEYHEYGDDLYGSFPAFCISINYILGVGVLGIPNAFAIGGYILSVIVMVVVTILAMICANWITEAMARAEGIHRYEELVCMHSDSVNNDHNDIDPIEYNQIAHNRRFEMNELSGIFLGQTARKVYETCVSIYFMGALWSYAAVFGSSLASNVPFPGINNGQTCEISWNAPMGCHALYTFYLLLFSFIVVPLTCAELPETKPVQIFLAMFRFVAMLLMCITSLIALYNYPLESSHEQHHTSSPPYIADLPLVNWAGMGTLLPICIYSQIFHHSVPGLIRPVSNKPAAAKILIAVLFTTFSFYTLVGISVSIYYGTTTKSTCSLNWLDYKGSHTTYTPAWAKLVKYTIVLFPPIDILSAYPLNALTLGNNLLTKFVRDEKKLTTRRYIVFYRLVASIPPIIGAIFVSNLATVLTYTGTLGIVIAFIYPSLLQYYSIQKATNTYGQSNGHWTIYSKQWLTNFLLPISVGSFGVCILLAVIALNINNDT